MPITLVLGVVLVVIAVGLGVFGVSNAGGAFGTLFTQAQALGNEGESYYVNQSSTNGDTTLRITCTDSDGNVRNVTDEYYEQFDGSPAEVEAQVAQSMGGLFSTFGGIFGSACVGTIGIVMIVIGIIGLLRRGSNARPASA